MTMTAKDILNGAKALISDPENWVKGRGIVFKKNGQRGFCALGALAAVCTVNALPWGAGHEARSMLYKALPRTSRLMARVSVAAYNDSSSTTHKDIMTLFGRAIALCE